MRYKSVMKVIFALAACTAPLSADVVDPKYYYSIGVPSLGLNPSFEQQLAAREHLTSPPNVFVERTDISPDPVHLPDYDRQWNFVQDRVGGAYSIKAYEWGSEYCLAVQLSGSLSGQVALEKCKMGREQGFLFNPQTDGTVQINSNIRWGDPAPCLTAPSASGTPFENDGIGFKPCGEFSEGQNWTLKDTGQPVD